METQNNNRGVLSTPRLATQWLVGVNSPIVVPQRGVSDWSQYLPDYARQSDTIMDSMACLTFSMLASIEAQVNADIVAGRYPDATVQYFQSAGYIVNGKFKCSARYSAKMNGTSKLGNYASMVGDGVSNGHDGLLPESDLPFIDGMTFDQFYANVTPQQVAKAKKIYQYLSVQYHELTQASQIHDVIGSAPVQVCTPVCAGWDSGSVVGMCSGNPDHATMVYGIDGAGHYLDFDTYPPFKQTLASDYELLIMIQYVAQPAAVTAPLPDTISRVLKVGMTGNDVAALQGALKALGYFPAQQAVTTFFGTVTLAAVEAFQTANSLKADGIVGSITYSQLTKKN